MNTIKLASNIKNVPYNELNNTDSELTNAAREATYKKAMHPTLNFHVGAAILLTNGLIIQGSNQENAAFGAGTCAERTALFLCAIRIPQRKIKAIAIAARGSDGDFTVCPYIALRNLSPSTHRSTNPHSASIQNTSCVEKIRCES